MVSRRTRSTSKKRAAPYARKRTMKKRTPAKKRPVTRRARRSTISRPVAGAFSLDESTRASLAIYRDPFSGVNGQGKIPDGKAMTSVSTRNQVAGELNSLANGDDLIHLLVYPGGTQGMVAWGTSGAQPGRNFQAFQFNDHMTYDISTPYGINGAFVPGNLVNNDNISEWRCVSQALKLSLLNTGEENDGWFECIRYKDAFNAQEFGFYSGDNQQQVSTCVYGPDATMKADLANKNLVNSPTYCSGALADIDKHMFQLQPQTDEHDYRKVSQRFYVDEKDCTAVGGLQAYLTMAENTAQAEVIHGGLIDPAYDAIYIRIHCRANTGAGANTGSRLLYHLIANHEVVYDEDQNEHKFMTRTTTANAAVKRANELKRKFAPASTPTEADTQAMLQEPARFKTSMDIENGNSHDTIDVFHPEDLHAYGVNDLISSDAPEPKRQRASDDPPDLIDEDLMEEDPVFIGEDGSFHDKEDVSIQIVPSKNQSGPTGLATNKNVGIIANLAGGIEATNSTYIHAPYNSEIQNSEITGVGEPNHAAIRQSLGDSSFNDFANAAYTSSEGYSLRVNPNTGEREMFIAGTRSVFDWVSNALEVRVPKEKFFSKHIFADLADSEHKGVGHHATPWRKHAQEHYENIVRDEQVDVIYGHSRGGAIVADMHLPPNVQKVGLDAAMVIADEKDMLNYYEAGPDSGKGWTWIKSRFDAGIGLSGKNNQHLNLSKKFHHSWGN